MNASGRCLTIGELEAAPVRPNDVVEVRIGDELYPVRRVEPSATGIVLEIDDVVAEMDDEALDVLRRYVAGEITARQLKAEASELL